MHRIDWSRVDFTKSNTELGKELGCTESAVAHARKRLGKGKSERAEVRRWRSLPPEVWQAKDKDIARALECSESVVYKWRRKLAAEIAARSQILTRQEWRALIRRDYPHLPDSVLDYIVERANQKHRTEDGLRPYITAYVRHNFTAYDSLLKPGDGEERKRLIRRQLRPEIDAVLHHWKTGQGAKPVRKS